MYDVLLLRACFVSYLVYHYFRPFSYFIFIPPVHYFSCFICTQRPDNNTTKKTFNCFGACDETICSACYFSTEILPLPSLEEGCPNICESDPSGETHSAICLRRWGKCLRRANLDMYGKVNKACKHVHWTISYAVVYDHHHLLCITLYSLFLF